MDTGFVNFLLLTCKDCNPQNKDYIYNVEVIKLLYDVLRVVQPDSVRYWNIHSLRNYLIYFYALSMKLSANNDQPECSNKSLKINSTSDQLSINVIKINEDNTSSDVDDEDVTYSMGVFFTGLFSSKKDKIFIVCKRIDNTIVRKVICCPKDELPLDLARLSIKLDCQSNLIEIVKQNEDILRPICLSDIQKLDIMSEDDIKKQLKNAYDKISASNPKKYLSRNNKFKGLLHILIDGADNISKDYLRLLFQVKEPNLDIKTTLIRAAFEHFDLFYEYEKMMVETINKAIENMDFSGCPRSFFVEGIANNVNNQFFQYLVPIDFLNLGHPDCFVVLGKQCYKEGKWFAVTLLNLNEAYGNIRIFGKHNIDKFLDYWHPNVGVNEIL